MARSYKNMKTKGTAIAKDFDTLLAWHNTLPLEDSERFVNQVNEWLSSNFNGFPKGSWEYNMADAIRNTTNNLYGIDVSFFDLRDPNRLKIARATAWERTKKEAGETLERYKHYIEAYGQPLQVEVWDDLFAYLHLGNPYRGIVIPNPVYFFDYHEPPAMDDVPVAMLKSKLGSINANMGPAIIPANADGRLTKASLRQSIGESKARLEDLNKEVDKVRKGESAELVTLKKQIEALQKQMEDKKNSLMIQLEGKMIDMEERVAQLEGQIYLLDSQIYAIQCAEGETVTFTQIRKGQKAPDTTPVIIYQKLRFLDEDLGRMASMYTLNWEDVGMFEEFLKHSPAALETFAPDQRCVTLVRLSRTGTRFDRSSKYPYSNLLEEYEYFHGRTVGIVIRNGDNLYLGWTDEDRIHINDDLILSRAVTTITPDGGQKPVFDDELYQKRQDRKERQKARQERMTAFDGLVSRVFVFSIIQGVVNNTDWLPLPAGISVSKQSPYVRFSLADMCLEDRRFVDFGKLIELANFEVMVGDPLLTMQNLRPIRTRYDRNDRGRGYADRTHDVRAQDCVIYPANLLENNELVPMVRYRYKSSFMGEEQWRESVCREDTELSEGSEIIGHFDGYPGRKVFISLEKENWRCRDVAPRANFELYSDEFINLAFMNSVWLTWAINTQTLGDWKIKGEKVIYAYAIKYLNTALEFIREREQEEKAAIDAIDSSVCENPDWPLHLTYWKMMLSRDKDSRSVRTITPFQAKRFVRWIKAGMPGLVEYGKACPKANA